MLDKITAIQYRYKRSLMLTVASKQFSFHLFTDSYFYTPHEINDLSIITPTQQVLGSQSMIVETLFGLFELCSYTDKAKTPFNWASDSAIEFDTGERVTLLHSPNSINKLLLVEMLARYIHTLWTIEDSVYDSYSISD